MTQILLRTRDAMVERRALRVAARLGADPVLLIGDVPQGPVDEPVGLLVELELDGAVEAIRHWRSELPELAIVAYLAGALPDLWRAAEEAGADAVAARGQADRELERQVVDRRSGARRARRIRVAPLQDFAGRLGYVGRIDETPCGPIALYHLAGVVHAVADTCPHAGASLCAGELDGDVITCPRHGSRFRVTDGARVRGPADLGVAVFPTVVEAGTVFIELPQDPSALAEPLPARSGAPEHRTTPEPSP